MRGQDQAGMDLPNCSTANAALVLNFLDPNQYNSRVKPENEYSVWDAEYLPSHRNTGFLLLASATGATMKRETVCALWTFVLSLTLTDLTGCSSHSIAGSSPAEPTITSFTANPTTVTAGKTANLTGVFSNGSGVITPGNIAATSGTAVEVSPSVTTSYKLTVTSSSGATATQSATVTVQTGASPINTKLGEPDRVLIGLGAGNAISDM